jgi:hypothetical protein
MKPRRNKAALAALLAGGAALLIGFPALRPALSQDAPESLLPPGFDEPVQPPRQPSETPSGPEQAGRLPTDLLPATPLQPPGTEGEETAEQETPEVFELPEEARRPIDVAGPFDGYGPAAFGGANGKYLSVVMRRLDAPLPSRWASITLRRALLSRVPTPRAIGAADWIAERAWLLLRMGEADGARLLVQGVDVDRFTPKMYEIAAQTALATADPAGLCPLVQGAMTFSKEPIWPFAQAMCAALSGETAISSVLLDHARRNWEARGIDTLLAEKVVGAGTNSRRAVTIEWAGVDRLTAWRFGLASSLALEIPDPLFETVGAQVQAWRARAPLYSPAARIAPARMAAALGVFSNAALVDLYGAAGDAADDYGVDTPVGRLRAAYVADDQEGRLTALRALWDDAKGGRDRYAASILTARAAARIVPSADYGADAAPLIAAMFSAGLDRQAARWARVVEAMDSSDADPAWAILAVGTPRPVVELGYGRANRFGERQGAEGRHKARMLIAALAGLGRLSPGDMQRLAEEYEIPIAARNGWTRALDQAVADRQPGTVVLLAAAGMQADDWRGVPPAHFYRIIAALRQVGLSGEARMIAAEAMSRL